MFVYKMVVYKTILNAFDLSEELDRIRYDLGLFSNKKKADQAFVNICDEELDWLIRIGEEKVEVDTEYPKVYKTRIEKKGEIIWMTGQIEKIKVQ